MGRTRLRHVKRSFRAVSTVLAVLLMIAIAIIAAVVVYAWTMGYLDFSTERSREAINIPSIVNDPTDTDLLVYVQNTGEGTTHLEENSCLYVNGTLVPCTVSGVNVSDGVATLAELEVATLTYAGGATLPNEKVEIKVTAVSGVFSTKSAYPAGIVGVPDVDYFVFSTVSSPQVSGVPFNITINAIDRQGNHFWDYSGINTLTCSSGEISPAVTGNFSYGSWTGEVTITGLTADITISTAMQYNPSKTGTSNSFTLFSPSEAVLNKTYGGERSESAFALIATSDGGYAIAGKTDSFGDGCFDFWLVKTDAYGNMEWNQTYGGKLDERAYSLVAASDGGYALAGARKLVDGNEGILLVKTDAYGNMEWNQTYRIEGDTLDQDLVATSDGGYAIVGSHVLVKTDSSGNMEWNQTFEGTLHDLIETSDGGYAIAGDVGDFLLIKTNASGAIEWNQTYGEKGNTWFPIIERAYSVVETADGGYALAGYQANKEPGIETELLVKTDAYGNMEWNRTYSITGVDFPFALAVTSDGGYIMVGYSSTTDRSYDACLIRTDASGNMEWKATYGGTGYEEAQSIVVTSDGGYAIAGYTTSYGAGSADFWLIKTYG